MQQNISSYEFCSVYILDNPYCIDNTYDYYLPQNMRHLIYRGSFITVPCNMYFTMDRKVKSFLESTFLIYRVPDEKIRESIDFVSQFDYKKISADVIDNMLEYLESRT